MKAWEFEMILGIFQSCHTLAEAREQDTPDDTTFIDIAVPSAAYEFAFLYVSGLKDLPAGGTIDWGDGSETVLDAWASELASGKVNHYIYPTAGAQNGVHAYAVAGDYTIKIKGNICGAVTCVNPSNPGSAPVIQRMSFKRTEAALSNFVPISQQVNSFKVYTGLAFADFSRIYPEEGAPLSFTFGSGAQPCTSGWTDVILPCRITAMANSYPFRYCSSVRSITFPDKTMSAVRSLPLSTGGSLWDFGYINHDVVFHCTDGEIKYVGGAWTDFPSN